MAESAVPGTSFGYFHYNVISCCHLICLFASCFTLVFSLGCFFPNSFWFGQLFKYKITVLTAELWNESSQGALSFTLNFINTQILWPHNNNNNGNKLVKQMCNNRISSWGQNETICRLTSWWNWSLWGHLCFYNTHRDTLMFLQGVFYSSGCIKYSKWRRIL